VIHLPHPEVYTVIHPGYTMGGMLSAQRY